MKAPEPQKPEPFSAVIGFGVKPTVKEQIEELAQEEQRTFSQMARILIDEALAARRKAAEGD